MKNIKTENSGQAMILSTVLIGGALLAASTIAGFVLFFQIRQAGDSVQSTAAFYAADAGIERAMYCYYREETIGIEKDVVCDEGGGLSALIGDAPNCGGSGSCKGIANYDVKLSCFLNPSNKTQAIPCKTVNADGTSPVKGIYIVSEGSSIGNGAERILDYTIITSSEN